MSKEIQLTNEELQFDALKKSATDMAKQCDLLVVNDPTTSAIAVQNLSLLKSTMKKVEEVHKEIKSPYLKACQQIDKLKNDLYNPMEESYKKGNKKVLDYNQEVQRKALLEQNRILGIKNAIAKYSNDAIAEMDACTTMDALKEVRTRLIVNAPLDKWAEFLPDFERTKLTLNDYAKSCRTRIETPAQADAEETVAIREEVFAEVNAIGKEEVAELTVPKMKGLRLTWDYEVVDKAQVPMEYLMVDDKKVREWMSLNKAQLEQINGDMFAGIKFFQKESLTIR